MALFFYFLNFLNATVLYSALFLILIMTLITAKKITRVYYQMNYSLDNNTTYREHITKKMACLCFIGIPFKIVSEIYVPSHIKDLE